MALIPHHPRPDPQYFLKYDPDWQTWTLYEHRRNLPDHILAEFSDGTPEKPPQLAENVLDLLTSPNKKEHNENEEGTHDQT
jgi:hypothetical protein